jgi:surface antigen
VFFVKSTAITTNFTINTNASFVTRESVTENVSWGIRRKPMSFIKTGAALAIVFAVQLSAGNHVFAESKTTTETKPKEVVATVAAGDSLSTIADTYKTTWVRIFDANDTLANPDIINAGDKLRIPREDEQLPDRYSQVAAQVAAQSAVATTATYTTKSYSSTPVNSSSYYVGNGMWCTDYVHSKRPDVAIYGNAGYNWISAAQANGKSTGTTAQAGAVAVTNGHVAYVESVNPDGSYVVSEMGWNYQAGNYNKRTVAPGTFGGFIY